MLIKLPCILLSALRISWPALLPLLLTLPLTSNGQQARVPALLPADHGTTNTLQAEATNPPNDPGTVSLLVSHPIVCAGDHARLTATGGNGTYTWTPNSGLSATTGATVIAGPLTTTTYTVNESVFRQTNDPYTSFSFSERYKQIGIKCRRLGATTAAQFTLLHTGIQLREMYRSALGFSVNTFTSCQRGIEAFGVGVNRGVGGSPPPVPPTVNFGEFSCNTFDRGSASRPGLAYGIILLQGSSSTFDPVPAMPPVTPPILSNKFLDWGTRGTGFQAIYNGSMVTTQDMRYSTFDNYVTQNNLIASNATNLSALCTRVSFPLTGYIYDPNQLGGVCGLGSPGLERQAKKSSELAPGSPNPGREQTSFAYQLPSSAKNAELWVKRSFDSQPVFHCALSPTGSSYELNLRGWNAGLYFVTLYVDGTPVRTRRLLVQ